VKPTLFINEDFTMRRTVALSGFLSMLGLAAASLIVLPNAPTRANIVNATFVIPASDGYGVADCLTGGTECGRVVADAWCEAQGFSRAETFGRAVEEVTGSTDAAMSKRSAAPIAITCAN
jgi:hypothetical protein